MTIIGRIIKALKEVPIGKNKYLNVLWPLLGTPAILLYALFMHKKITTLDLFSGVITSVFLFFIFTIASWLRKVMDQRYVPAKQFDLCRELFDKVIVLNQLACTELEKSDFFYTTDYCFPNGLDKDGLLEKVSRINYKCFSASVFADSFDRKYRRNKSHQKKNSLCLMLVSFSELISTVVDYIGFTHLIPIDEITYGEYVDGKISDMDFSARQVCSEIEPAYAILIFSLGFDAYELKRYIQGRELNHIAKVMEKIGVQPYKIMDMRDAEYYLWVAFAYHLCQLLKNQKFVDDEVVLLAQSINKTIASLLLAIGFKELKGRSADNERIFEFRIKKPDISEV